jgi:membrane-associated protease RseP (regulator of RpoE activity)
MKRCNTCNRTYTDPKLVYCTEDGTPLTTEVDEDAPYRPPSAYVPPGARPPSKQRRAWPWAFGILAAFLLGAVVLTIVAAIFVPRMVRSRQPDVPVAVTTEEKDQTEKVDAPPPTDEQQVLAQLTDIENDWTVANFNADKKKLQRILADDYIGPASEQGGLQGKREYIDTIQRETSVERWELNDLKVRLSGDRAILTGRITYFTASEQAELDFVDKFVWRDGRWQATGSEVKRRE